MTAFAGVGGFKCFAIEMPVMQVAVQFAGYYESPEGSCEIRNSRYEIRDTKCEIRDTASLANHVHAHYDVPKTKDGECCRGDVAGLRLIRRSICLHCWARRQL